MVQGNGSSAPGEPPSALRMLLEAWARELSPTHQSTGVSLGLDRFGEDTVKSAAHLRRLIVVAAYAMAFLAVLLVASAVLATAVEWLRLSGVLPSHGRQLTVPHLLPPGFLVTIASGGGLWWRSVRKRHRSPPGTEGPQAQQPAVLRPTEGHCPGCRGHDED